MSLFSNYLSHQAERELIKNKLLPHLVGPAVTFALTILVEYLSRFEWYTPIPVILFIGLGVSAIWGGLRSSLLSASIITGYVFVELDSDPGQIIQVALTAYSIATVNGLGRRLLRHWILEAEYYRQKSIDNYNGNRAKMVEALDSLDKALQADDITKVRKLVETARIKQADTLTLMSSWHEMAKDKRLAIEALETSAGYPWRADEKIKQIDLLAHEIHKEVFRMRRLMEAVQGVKDED
jgi:hypothetical protein